MNQDLLKPVRLEELKYRQLREQVLRRDSWRCQFCGAMTNLEVHHQQFRSHLRLDEKDNLITLCNCCHRSVHNSGSSASREAGIC